MSAAGEAVTDTEVIEDRRTEVHEPGDHERMAHIIRKKDEMSGYFHGEEVTALCGKRWVPSRLPDNFPICQTCVEVLAQMRAG
jgi:hypothetical protein